MIKTESFAYRNEGKMRFIGIDAWRTGEDWGGLWERTGDFMPELEKLRKRYAAGISEPCSLMHAGGKAVGVEEHFLAGYFFKADTPVPEGYDYFDVETTCVGYGVYVTQDIGEDMENAYSMTRDRILGDGYLVPYPQGYWHAEVYTNGRPHEGEYRFGYVFPVFWVSVTGSGR